MKKILIIAPAWVGDIVMMQVLLKFLKAKYPCEITVLSSSWAYDLIQLMPEVTRVLELDLPHGKLNLMRRFRFAKSIKKYKFSDAYVLPNSFKSALIPYIAQIKNRYGFVGELRYGLLNHCYKLDKLKLPRMIDRFVALANDGNLAYKLEHPKLISDKYNQNNLLDKFTLDRLKPIIALCPGAQYGPAKRWPGAYFMQLAKELIQSDYQIIILGSKEDNQYAQPIERELDSKLLINLCGLTSLKDTVDLLALAKLAVTNDSGLMHIACSVNVAVIAIYGSSSPEFTPPLSNNVAIVYNKLECSPCFARECKFGHYNCLKTITPEAIYKRIKEMSHI